MKILIVGSGTAGLISALILKKRFPHFTIDVVSSKNIGIVGVGEGSTEHFADFAKFVGIDLYDMIKKTDATYKSSIYFEGWGGRNYFHSVAAEYTGCMGQYPYKYARQIANNYYIHPQIIKENKINQYFLNRTDESPYNQFHFNTFKLNEYLINISKDNYINFFEDEINSVNFNSNGFIESLSGNYNNYRYDFYIDATGFKRLLIGGMGSEWKSFSEHLKMNSAVTFQTGDEDEYNIWTLSKSMNAGWMFKIPTWGRHGNGYIYDKNYISVEEVKDELSYTLNKEIEIGKSFSFDPGYIKNPWIKNCLAIGLSGSFVEPLEATSIATSINQTFLLMHKIVNYTEYDINQYNKIFEKIMLNIRDFIFIHYMVNDNKSKFWIDMQKVSPPDELKEKMLVWKNRLPIKEDFIDISNYSLFFENNFLVLLHGIGWFNIDSITQEFYSHDLNIQNEANIFMDNVMYHENNINKMGHKKYLSVIRENL